MLQPITWEALARWGEDDHAAALRAFLRTVDPSSLAGRSGLALAADLISERAREFFEQHFTPHRVRVEQGRGFVTGYFEPEVEASRTPSVAFPTPILARPPGLAPKPTGQGATLDPSLSWAIHLGEDWRECADRAAIAAGFFHGQGLELAYVRSPIDLFFMQVQGSARLKLTDGTVLRLGFDGKSGHPYTSIAKVLIAEGALDPATASAETLRHWLEVHPHQLQETLNKNQSYVFFKVLTDLSPEDGPVGAAQVPLTAHRSLAIDHHHWAYGLPIYLEAMLPLPDGTLRPFDRLMIAQDTGSAIVGPARGDIFCGTGRPAWQEAALIRHPADFTVLLPSQGPSNGA